MSTTTKIILTVVAIALVLFAFWFWGKGEIPTTAPNGVVGNGLGSDLYNKVVPSSTQTIPETNPFKAVQTNPFNQ